MTITRLNPDMLNKNPTFTQVVVVDHPARYIFVGGQNGIKADGGLAGTDIVSQAEQAFRNVIAALDSAGATLHDIVRMTIYIVHGQPLREAFAASHRVQSMSAHPPAISVIIVAGLANPEFLIEIDAVAAVSQETQL